MTHNQQEERARIINGILAIIMQKRSEFAKFGIKNRLWIKKNGREAVKLFILASMNINYIQEQIKPLIYHNPYVEPERFWQWEDKEFKTSGIHIDEAMAQFVQYARFFRMLTREELREVEHGAIFLLPFYGECVNNSRILSCREFRDILCFANGSQTFHSAWDEGCVAVYKQ